MCKKNFLLLISFFLLATFSYGLDVIEAANRDFLTLEETISLAEKEPVKNKELISILNRIKKLSDTAEIYELIDRCPYMPCTEAVRFLILSPEDQLNSANYIYSVFTGCPKENPLKDQIYLKILEASIKEDNYSWSYNAARDLSDKAKENPVYKSFMTAISQN